MDNRNQGDPFIGKAWANQRYIPFGEQNVQYLKSVYDYLDSNPISDFNKRDPIQDGKSYYARCKNAIEKNWFSFLSDEQYTAIEQRMKSTQRDADMYAAIGARRMIIRGLANLKRTIKRSMEKDVVPTRENNSSPGGRRGKRARYNEDVPYDDQSIKQEPFVDDGTVDDVMMDDAQNNDDVSNEGTMDNNDDDLPDLETAPTRTPRNYNTTRRRRNPSRPINPKFDGFIQPKEEPRDDPQNDQQMPIYPEYNNEQYQNPQEGEQPRNSPQQNPNFQPPIPPKQEFPEGKREQGPNPNYFQNLRLIIDCADSLIENLVKIKKSILDSTRGGTTNEFVEELKRQLIPPPIRDFLFDGIEITEYTIDDAQSAIESYLDTTSTNAPKRTQKRENRRNRNVARAVKNFIQQKINPILVTGLSNQKDCNAIIYGMISQISEAYRNEYKFFDLTIDLPEEINMNAQPDNRRRTRKTNVKSEYTGMDDGFIAEELNRQEMNEGERNSDDDSDYTTDGSDSGIDNQVLDPKEDGDSS